MGKRLILVLALALVVGLTFSAAYAEVQNVNVSGDINVLGVTRSNFDLGYGPVNNNDQNLFTTQIRVRIDADLTDNVMATVRLINERNWSGETVSSTDIDLDLAYVTLKEFLYSPLTLTVGRQELRFGNALIVGNGTQLVNGSAALNGLPRDLTIRKAFDAIRATLNYDPLIIDAVYAKVSNLNTNTSDDNDLIGINASYDISKKLNVQAYVWDKRDKTGSENDSKKDNVTTIGTLISASPIENLKTSFEGALQTGHNRRNNEAAAKQHRGFALQGLADYTFAKCKYTP
ncbi:MAG: putative porin, partial [Candidatus Omnitrophota bacterium]|nr:putative porin [Candidatus Omnitrophota bacterium]